MIMASGIAWLGFLILVGLTSLAGVGVSRRLPWGEAAVSAGIPFATGLVLAPFLAGVAAVLVLGLGGGASPTLHLSCVLGLLAVLSWLAHRPGHPAVAWRALLPQGAGLAFLALLALYAGGLMLHAVTLPLTQNDALEYATVGRLLFETRNLSAYPALHPELGTSGFYGPWTHPPLYVALLYLTQLLQGHADTPGLMRLIAPWFLLATTALVYALGMGLSRLTAVLAGLFFISTPLLYLGADSALIDPLPVAGITLVFALVTGLQGPPVWRGCSAGVALGLALWTHSQAVLFIPLSLAVVFALHGLRGWGESMRLSAAMVSTAVAVAFWPYVRNLAILGSLVSDTPIVFSLPLQAWEEYFRFARGIDTWPALLQYGIFKGWFALEAYSVSFWIALPGIVGMILRLRPADWRTWLLEGVRGAGARLLLAALVLLLVYWAGVIVSASAGVTLMIRNERYWLVLLPFIALFAAHGVATVHDRLRAGRLMKPFAQVILAGIFMVSSLQLWTLAQYRQRPYTGQALLGTPGDWAWQVTPARTRDRAMAPSVWRPVAHLHFDQKFSGWPNVLAMMYLRQTTPTHSLVFSLRPADMYYAGRRMVSYLDPRLLAFYAATDVESAWWELVKLGVSHVHVSDYYLPPIYRSRLQDILGQPELAELVFSANGHQIYQLRHTQAPTNAVWIRQDLTPGQAPWTRRSLRMLGGRKVLETMTLRQGAVPGGNAAPREKGSGWFQRDWSTLLLSGEERAGGAMPGTVAVPGQQEFRVDLTLYGQGFVKVWVAYLDADRQPLWERNVLIGELVLGESNPHQTYLRRLVPPPLGTLAAPGGRARGGFPRAHRQGRHRLEGRGCALIRSL